jgi:DNA-binding IclR family transcriptional regulator
MQESQTLLRGVNLLEVIASEGSGLSIRQLAEKIKLPRTIVHRLLLTLENSGYVRKNLPRPGYRLGTKLWWLGCAAIRDLNINEVAHPYLEELAAATKELVNVAILDQQEVVYIDKVDCSQSVRAHIPIGGKAPASRVATGQAILAFLEEKEVTRIVSLGQRNSGSMRSLARFRDELKQIRRRGYSVSVGTYRAEVGGVAAPIHDRNGNPIAAIGITFPANRVTKAGILRFGRLVMDAADGISQEFGYSDMKLKRAVNGRDDS